MRFLALITLILSSCCLEEEVPNTVDPPDGAAEAEEIILNEWSDRFQYDLHGERTIPPVYWQEGGCVTYDQFLDGILIPDPYSYIFQTPSFMDKCYAGVFLYNGSKCSPEIRVLYHDKVSKTVLAHEFLHWALWIVEHDGDPEHEHPFWGEDLDEVQETLREAGL